MICPGPECTREVFYPRVGLCHAHYMQQYRGQPLTAIVMRVHYDHCTGPGCDRPVWAHGLCNTHNRQRIRGVALKPIRKWVRR